jgi:hypothetical protein
MADIDSSLARSDDPLGALKAVVPESEWPGYCDRKAKDRFRARFRELTPEEADALEGTAVLNRILQRGLARGAVTLVQDDPRISLKEKYRRANEKRALNPPPSLTAEEWSALDARVKARQAAREQANRKCSTPRSRVGGTFPWRGKWVARLVDSRGLCSTQAFSSEGEALAAIAAAKRQAF